MKKLFRSHIITTALVFIFSLVETSNVFAQQVDKPSPELKLHSIQKQQQVFELKFNSDKRVRFEVTIKDANNLQLLSERLIAGKSYRIYKLAADDPAIID